MGKVRIILLISFVMAILSFCAINVRRHHQKNDGISSNTNPNLDSLGEKVYEKHCLTCHQKDGSGVSSMYPPISNNPRVRGEKERLIKIILEGQSGRIEVHGEYYNGVMPPFRNLSDREVAAVLTYMRQNFKNDTTAVTVKEVKAVRDTL